MRAFLALNLSSKLRSYLALLQRELKQYNVKNIKWVSEDNLHITIQFIEDLDTNHLKEITEYLFEEIQKINDFIEFTKIRLNFNSDNKPKIIWIQMNTENKQILRLHKNFQRKLVTMGYPIDKKKLLFHITLGRIKKRLPDFFIRKILTTELNIKQIEVSEAALYSSILRPEGPLYDTEAKFIFSKE